MSENLTEVEYEQAEDLYDNLVYAVDSVYMWERSTTPSSTSDAMDALTKSFDNLQTELLEYLDILSTDVEAVWLSVKTLIDCDTDVSEYIRGKMCGFPAQDVYIDDLPTGE